jgi:hypothetical protein
MLEPVRAEAVLPDWALCLPTFSLFLIVNKTSLSLCHPPTSTPSSSFTEREQASDHELGSASPSSRFRQALQIP